MQTTNIPPPLPAPPTTWADRLNSPLARLMLIGVLLLVLLWPLGMIENVVRERESARDDAVIDVMNKFGNQQDIVGPLLRVPYFQNVIVKNDGPVLARTERRTYYAYFLPEVLQTKAQLQSDVRHRGIFEVPVYQVSLHLKGRYQKPNFAQWNIAEQDIDWTHAELVLGVSDPRAIHADAGLNWNGKSLGFKPSSGPNAEWNTTGIYVPLGAQEHLFNESGADFEVVLNLNGSERLFFTPMAERSTVNLDANWPHPSFQGNWLPTKSTVSASGFQSQWSISYLGRDFPQQWRGSPAQYEAAIKKSLFGVNLISPVDQYTMATRISKYAVLTLVFTFLVLWLLEVLSGQRIHAIQYGFIGVALCLFGLLQLSFAEHFGFNAAFATATLAVTTMVTLYAKSVLRSMLRAVAVGLTLGGLYAYLYMILRAEDYALLGGSLALFIALAVAMYLTRRIDWFQLNSSARHSISDD